MTSQPVLAPGVPAQIADLFDSDTIVWERGCRLWTGATNGRGYGQLRVKGKLYRAHRYVYELVNGPIPAGLCVLHRCDVRACVNPAHLFLGTNADNTADMMAKGRGVFPTGERASSAKLTEHQVRIIRQRCAAGETHRSVAAMFGISHNAVGSIVRRRTWREVQP